MTGRRADAGAGMESFQSLTGIGPAGESNL